ncbi:DNA cytosine methyltransferase [Streptomyces sp. NPDC091287]|uniref:DNA cytosine methyltransferase n=1 Tax=Streptomyces sp. NPDC091287 TaxID=3365988 RepID=UPI003808F8EA
MTTRTAGQKDLTPAMTSCIEICAGAGGQALGLQRAGFEHTALVELDPDATQTLRLNRPGWNIMQADVRGISAKDLTVNGQAVGLLAAGVPCPPFSLAGEQLGPADERDLFPDLLRLAGELRPSAVMVENVKGILQAKFAAYRADVISVLTRLGYRADWRLLRACDYKVPQLRPRAVLVAMRPEVFERFRWPSPTSSPETAPAVGSVLYESMASAGWELARQWADGAMTIAPTICGGSRKHGGADLGPSRARKAWAQLGVNGSSVADEPPQPGTALPVRLTVRHMALLQGFPDDWYFAGNKTSVYRQVGNAFPPPVAKAVGQSLAAALGQTATASRSRMPQTPRPPSDVPGSTLFPPSMINPGFRA